MFFYEKDKEEIKDKIERESSVIRGDICSSEVRIFKYIKELKDKLESIEELLEKNKKIRCKLCSKKPINNDIFITDFYGSDSKYRKSTK